MDITLFKEYEEWCQKENKDPLKEETVGEFKLYEQKQREKAERLAISENEKKAKLVEKQKEIFKLFCEYTGVKAKYDESYMFVGLDDIIKSCVAATVVCENGDKCVDALKKLLG